MKKAMHITIIANTGSTNIGDEALLESQLQLIRQLSDNVQIHIMSSNVADTLKRYGETYGVTASPMVPAGPRSLLTQTIPFLQSLPKLSKTDAVLFGGGGLFTDNSGWYACLLWWLPFFVMHTLLKKPVYFIGQSFHPFRSAFAKRLTNYAVKRAKIIMVRDHISEQIVQSEFRTTCTVAPDLAWLLPLPKNHKVHHNTHHIAISLRPWAKIADIQRELATYVAQWPKKPFVHLVSMQHERESDIGVLQALQQDLVAQGVQTLLHQHHNYKEVEQLLTHCDYAIGMRLHFCILAARSQVPTIALSYSSKVTGMAQTLHMPFIELDDIGSSELAIALLQAEQELAITTQEAKQAHQKALFAYTAVIEPLLS